MHIFTHILQITHPDGGPARPGLRHDHRRPVLGHEDRGRAGGLRIYLYIYIYIHIYIYNINRIRLSY